MSGYRLPRRRLLLGMTAASAALAGCIDGGESGGSGSSDGTAISEPRTDTPTESTPTAASTDTPTPTQSESTGACAAWDGPTTSYDAAGTPFFFSYDYVEGWTPEGTTEYSGGHFVRFTSPPVADGFTLTLRVSQSLTAFTAAERDEEVEYFLDFEAEPREVVDEITYDGETLRVLGLADKGSYYQPGLNVFLPYGSGENRRYYPVGAVLFDGLSVPQADRSACVASAEAAQSTVIRSLAPNPDTTFEGAR